MRGSMLHIMCIMMHMIDGSQVCWLVAGHKESNIWSSQARSVLTSINIGLLPVVSQFGNSAI
jgi:hypothetical protein